MSTKKKSVKTVDTSTRKRGVNTRGWTCVAIKVEDNETLDALCKQMSAAAGTRVVRKDLLGLAIESLRVDALQEPAAVVEAILAQAGA